MRKLIIFMMLILTSTLSFATENLCQQLNQKLN